MTAYSYRKNYKSLARTKIKSNVYIVSCAQRSWSQEEYLFYLTRSNWSYVEIKISLFFVEFLVLPTKNTFLNSFSFDFWFSTEYDWCSYSSFYLQLFRKTDLIKSVPIEFLFKLNRRWLTNLVETYIKVGASNFERI